MLSFPVNVCSLGVERGRKTPFIAIVTDLIHPTTALVKYSAPFHARGALRVSERF